MLFLTVAASFSSCHRHSPDKTRQWLDCGDWTEIAAGWWVTAQKSNRLRGLPHQLCSIDSDHMTEGIPALHCHISTKRQQMRQHNVHVSRDCACVCVHQSHMLVCEAWSAISTQPGRSWEGLWMADNECMKEIVRINNQSWFLRAFCSTHK